jgi:hypothetical protein
MGAFAGRASGARIERLGRARQPARSREQDGQYLLGPAQVLLVVSGVARPHRLEVHARRAEGERSYGWQVLSSTLTVSSLPFARTRSSLPSPFRSAAATETGAMPVG